MSFENRLTELGLELPPARAPLYSYVPVVVEGGLAWVSGQLPWHGEGLLATGRLGQNVDIEAGRACARLCVLHGLASLRAELGSLDRVRRIVKVVGFVSSAADFYDQAMVVDGASTLLGELFGEAGRHARSAIGMAALPRNTPVEVEFVAAVV
ncbi:MAG: LysR family transcriptional regulator [Acetobacteraceae bacterium SCN 69-10]|nr:RidA family protein [Rhodospirillales bacterium]ODU60797.1 MAG: LysR family transcriptional regulator [Acetobacteraceae bacterium SCN 69-10]OJY64940.1 MAG: LysR family transcriptional regulator [Rhodospirillales bacterium 70-18]